MRTTPRLAVLTVELLSRALTAPTPASVWIAGSGTSDDSNTAN